MSLSIREQGSSELFRLWPDPEQVRGGAIRETGQYLLELTGLDNPLVAELYVDDVRLEALRPPDRSTARWRWSPGFFAGVVNLSIEFDGRRRHLEIVTDPDLRKLTRNEFDLMLAEILEDTFALFALSGFRVGIARGHGTRPPPLARLEFLRSRLAPLIACVSAIDRNPQRALRRVEIGVPYYATRVASGSEVVRSLRSSRLVRQTSAKSRLPKPLRGYLPKTIRTTRLSSDLDTREHRDIKACLRAWAAWLTQVSELLEPPSATGPDDARVRSLWSGRVRGMALSIRSLLELPLFRHVSDGPPHVLATSVYRRIPSYSRFLGLHRDFNRGIANVFGDFLNVPLSRTFELYELWCFLRLLRAAVAGRFASADDVRAALPRNGAAGTLTLPSGPVTVPLLSGMALSFQLTFREYWRDAAGRGSFSRPMRPDVTLSGLAPQERPIIVLDAKYRIDTNLDDALSSIHTYRDALVQSSPGIVQGIVKGAYLLSPHLPTLRLPWQDESLPGRLFHPVYRSSFRFGAVTLRPGMPVPSIVDVLATLIADAGTGAVGMADG